MNKNKSDFRKEMLSMRDEVPPEIRRRLSSIICSRILTSEVYGRADMVVSYSPIRSEVDVREITLHALAHKTVAVPRIGPDGMDFHIIQSISELSSGTFGVSEPSADNPILKLNKDLTSRVLVLFPGCAFSVAGYRTGYGKGYYDRYFYPIADRKNIIKAGVLFGLQLCDDIPTDETDVRLDMLFTEEETLYIRSNENGGI